MRSALLVKSTAGSGESSGSSPSLAVGPEAAFSPAVLGARTPCQDGVAAGYPCRSMHLASFLPISGLGGGAGVNLNSMWGWEDPQTGRRYALVGRTNGTAFVDVTDPELPVYLGSLASHGGRNSSWRDVRVYRDHAYIVADAQPGHGLQVMDLKQLRGVNSPIAFAETAHYFGFGSAHTITINEETGFAFVVGASGGLSPTPHACAGGLVMLDLASPVSPQFAGCFNHPGTGRAGMGYTHEAQCVVYRGPDERYQGREICFGANETALSIADVTDKAAPTVVGLGEYPGTQYAHQGWLTEDHRYLFLGDELDELNDGRPIRTLIFDVAKLDDPVVAAEYVAPRSGIDHNQYVVGRRLYQANYKQGIQVLDITDPLNPKEVGRFDTTPVDGTSVWDGTWQVYPFFGDDTILASSIGQGLFVLEFDASTLSTGTEPREPAAVPTGVELGAPWPNPFTSSTRLDARFASTGPVRVAVLDLLGRSVQVVFDGHVESGASLDFEIPGTDLVPGTYLVQIRTASGTETRTIVRGR